MRVSQKRDYVLDDLKSHFGGYIRRTTNTPEWQVTNRKAAHFLTTIRPYLFLKAREADVALAFQAGNLGGADAHTQLMELKHA